MTTLRDVKKAAKPLEAIVTQDRVGDQWRLGVEAPKGFTWSSDGGIHELVDWTYVPWKPDYEDMLSRMSYGIEPCDDPHCEWCHPVND